MQFNLVSLFPEFFDSPLGAGLMARAQDSGLVSFNRVNPRDFSPDRHRTVDDRPYGGGPGMVMMLDPLVQALESIGQRGRIIMLSPRGRVFDQSMARELAREEDLTFVCGRYEGIDERLLDIYPVELVSMGDYVLNGGEAAALCMVESVARLVPGFMGHEDSGEEESHSAGLLEYPHYTRPETYEGLAVPEVLQCGDHGRIAAWRREQALEQTLHRRPDLLDKTSLTQEDIDVLCGLDRTTLGRNLYIALTHYPVLNKFGEKVAVSLTNLDVHDISRVSRSYNAGGFYAVTPIEDQKALAKSLLDHWVGGAGSKANPDRAEALSLVRVVDDIASAVLDIERRTGQSPVLAATSAQLDRRKKAPAPLRYQDVRNWLKEKPVLLIFGTGHGLAEDVVDMADGVLRPIRYLDEYNHLSVRSAVTITVDRLLADVF
ncbi:tRNA (guanosine(37)-N1)-methyltransferase TrmD [Pseudodesulfovibrio senegalensis]|uniref:tRNA (guanine-N(1)-)-methyltransferase n=1 Tax=Pseudodesulfovibrio senegalensis TaxID=1721087 RepID=A0A6N6N3E9_9BACT|nr:tRNA (guanosine(37)-N1)-methyltransferase TrmD [Pseudodesulfovibrio senegalensis]KAB1442770.1 tRNA (guanosine(37)-N1)-methyltransferase TrmD [Pseudodesulfovibrio senegalensis]